MNAPADDRRPPRAGGAGVGGGKRRRTAALVVDSPPQAPHGPAETPVEAAGWRRWFRHVLVNGVLVALGGTLLLLVLRVATVDAPAVAGGAAVRHAPTVVFGAPRVGPTVVRPPRRVPLLPPPRAKRKPLLRTPMERARAGETMTVQMTAYCLQGTTRMGNPVRLGIVAADPRYFPLGREIDVSVGRKVRARYRVDDTGSAIKGLILDLWTPSCAEARKFGRRFGTATLVERK